MKKKAFLLSTMLVLCGFLAACGHEHTWVDATCTEPKTCSECGETEGEALSHDWQDATCTEPKTCSRCGETEGEALGHDWQDATCTEPKTCSRCGETEGEPLGHTLTEANYQDSAVCTVCGETVGEPLTPDFVTYGINTDMEVGVPYDYETTCYVNHDIKTVADQTVLDYNIFDSDDTHEAKEGYEWRVATFQVIFNDNNAYDYGYLYMSYLEDYYNTLPHGEAVHYDDYIFTVNYHGEDMECLIREDTVSSGWQGKTATITVRVSCQVPVGYDGCVYGFFDVAYEDSFNEGSYLYDIYAPDTFHLFRFA